MTVGQKSKTTNLRYEPSTLWNSKLVYSFEKPPKEVEFELFSDDHDLIQFKADISKAQWNQVAQEIEIEMQYESGEPEEEEKVAAKAITPEPVANSGESENQDDNVAGNIEAQDGVEKEEEVGEANIPTGPDTTATLHVRILARSGTFDVSKPVVNENTHVAVIQIGGAKNFHTEENDSLEVPDMYCEMSIGDTTHTTKKVTARPVSLAWDQTAYFWVNLDVDTNVIANFTVHNGGFNAIVGSSSLDISDVAKGKLNHLEGWVNLKREDDSNVSYIGGVL